MSRTVLLALISTAFILAGCSTGPASQESQSPPDYKVKGSETDEQNGMLLASFATTTKAKSENDFKLITEDLSKKHPKADGLIVQFFAATDKSALHPKGGAIAFKNEQVARKALSDTYSDSRIEKLMSEEDGILVFPSESSLDKGMNELAG